MCMGRQHPHGAVVVITLNPAPLHATDVFHHTHTHTYTHTRPYRRVSVVRWLCRVVRGRGTVFGCNSTDHPSASDGHWIDQCWSCRFHLGCISSAGHTVSACTYIIMCRCHRSRSESSVGSLGCVCIEMTRNCTVALTDVERTLVALYAETLPRPSWRCNGTHTLPVSRRITHGRRRWRSTVLCSWLCVTVP